MTGLACDFIFIQAVFLDELHDEHIGRMYRFTASVSFITCPPTTWVLLHPKM